MISFATKHNDPEKSLGWGERIGYASGGFAFNMINGIIGSFLTIYFTSALGLNAGIVASIFAVSKLFDGVSDLIVGRVVDRTKSRMGKGRVWLMRMCIPFGVATMLLFYVPGNLPEMAQYVYIFLMYNIVNAVCLTFMLVPYYSMVSLLTNNAYERGFLGNIQQIFQTLGNVVVNSTFITLLAKFTDSTETLYTQRAFTLTMLVYCVVMVLASLFCVFSTKERVTQQAQPAEEKAAKKKNDNVLATVKALLTNRYWVIMVLANFVIFFIIIMYSMGNVFYCQYVLGNMDSYGMMSNAISVAQFAIMFVTPLFMKKFGKSAIYTAGMLVMTIGFLGFGLFGGSSTALMVVFNAFKGAGVGMAGGMALGMVADTVTYGKLKSGIDTVGMGNAGISASQKIGLGLGTAVFGWVTAAAGYDGALDAQGIAQPAGVTTAINFLYSWLPAILGVVVFVIMLLLYHCERDIKRLSGEQ